MKWWYHTLSFGSPHACPTNPFNSCLLGPESAYPSAELGLLLSELRQLRAGSTGRSRIEAKKCLWNTRLCFEACSPKCEHPSCVQLIPTGGGRQEREAQAIAAKKLLRKSLKKVILLLVSLSSSKLRWQNECDAEVHPGHHFTYNAEHQQVTDMGPVKGSPSPQCRDLCLCDEQASQRWQDNFVWLIDLFSKVIKV